MCSKFIGVLIAATLLVRVSAEQALTLSWEASLDPDVISYVLCVGEVEDSTLRRIPLGETTGSRIRGLVPGRTYLIYVTAVDATGLESEPSNTLIYTVPSDPMEGLAEDDAGPGDDGENVSLAAFSQLAPAGQLLLLHSTIPGKEYQLAFDLGAFSTGTPAERLMNITVTGSAVLLTETWSALATDHDLGWTRPSMRFIADSLETTVTFKDVSPTVEGTELFLHRVQLMEE